MTGQSLRLFVAVDIPYPNEVAPIISSIKHADIPLKAIDPENSHVTLKFLGDQPADVLSELEAVVRSSLQGCKAFEVKLHGVGIFGRSRDPRVLWVGLQDGGGLEDLAYRVQDGFEKLGIHKENRKFKAHLTLGRFKGHRGRPPRLDREQSDKIDQLLDQYGDLEMNSHLVDKVIMKKSILRPEGPVYCDEFIVELDRS